MTTLRQPHERRSVPPGLCAACLLAVLLTGPARTTARSEDLEALVQDGHVEALERRFPEPRNADQLRMLALAQRNRAASISDTHDRRNAYEDAARRFEAWIERLRVSARDPRQRAVELAEARMIYADMILGGWLVPDFDALERTDLHDGDRLRVTRLLVRARSLCREAATSLEPLRKALEGSDRTREKFLVLGILDPLETLPDQIAYRLAWADVYLARYGGRGAPPDEILLPEATAAFEQLLAESHRPSLIDRARLGLAIALWQQRRYADASVQFRALLRHRVDPALEAQGRYFWARNEIDAGRFGEARTILRPMVSADPAGATQPGPILFYRNLAEIWFARSRLLEAERLERLAGGQPGPVLRRRIHMLREQGLLALHALARRSAAWRALIDVHVADHLRADTPPSQLEPVELLFLADRLMRENKPAEAAEVLREALGRPDVSRDLRPELLFASGRALLASGQRPQAAATFELLLQQPADDGLLFEAAAQAVQARLQIARQSRRPEDARHVARLIDRILKHWPQHPQRAALLWTRAVALWQAGDFDQAAQAFARIPPDSPHAAEAAFRRVMAIRRAYELRRPRLDAASRLREAQQAAGALLEYARSGELASDHTLARAHAAEARVSAAELYVEAGGELARAALNVLAEFERTYPDSPLRARVLAARIAAFLQLGDVQAALRRVDDFVKSASAEQVGPVLARVAQALLDQLPERREQAGKAQIRAATQAVPLLRRLRDWAAQKPRRHKYRAAAAYGLARALYVAGRYGEALRTLEAQLQDDPANGPYLLLAARVRTAMLRDGAPLEAIRRARDAWGRLLADGTLRQRAPKRYYEARYHYLELTLRAGRADDVLEAIRQERIWDPTLGGPPWQARFVELEKRAARAAGRVRP